MPDRPDASADPLGSFCLRSRVVTLAGRRFDLLVLDDDEVLAALAPAADNPYFGLLWDSAIVLAERVMTGGDLAGRTVLDLGCGVGLTGIAAAVKRGAVTFADVMPQALALARRNAERAGVGGRFLELDLRHADRAGERFDVVLASDVLYEKARIDAVIAAVETLLAPGGVALLSDPCRASADDFDERARRAGFDVTTTKERAPDGNIEVRTFELRA